MITVYVKTGVGGQTYTVKMNKYESILSLKERLRESDNIDFDNSFLLYSGRILEDMRCLAAYGIENGSNIQLETKLNGGNILSIEILFIAILMFGFMIFAILLSSGALPVIANVFYYLIKYALDTIISAFTLVWNFIKHEEVGMETVTGQLGGQHSGKFNIEASKAKYKTHYQTKLEQEGAAKAANYNFLSWIYDAFLFILKNGITLIFVYTFAAILAYPILLYKTAEQCKSLDLASYVGIMTATVYFLLYGLYFNLTDTIISIYLFASSVLPTFLKFIPDFLVNIVQSSWDQGKFAGFYVLPGIGEALLTYHQNIESVMIYIKEFLDQIAPFGCDNENKYQNIQKLFAQLVYKNGKNGEKIQHIGRARFTDNYMISVLREFIMTYNLDATVKLSNDGFNEDTINEAKFISEPFFKKIISSDYWNWQVSSIIKSIICIIFNFGDIANNFIDAMYGPAGVDNMIKSGNISGIITWTAFIVILAYTVMIKSKQKLF